MKRAIRILIVLSFAAALIAPGCYTMISHPKDEYGYTASQSSDCLRCHSDFAEFPYGYYYSPYPDHWWVYEKYGMFYAYPWWWTFYEQDKYANRGTKFDPRDPHDPPEHVDTIIYLPYPTPIPSPPMPTPMPPSYPKPEDSNQPRDRNDTGNTGDTGDKETRQDNVTKPSGPKSEGSSSGSGNTNTNSGSTDSNTSGGKIDTRKGKP
ncbi:MAG: hypothetical protein R3F48_07610 [Candidatus Zixiibacteriota bacterium]